MIPNILEGGAESVFSGFLGAADGKKKCEKDILWDATIVHACSDDQRGKHKRLGRQPEARGGVQCYMSRFMPARRSCPKSSCSATE